MTAPIVTSDLYDARYTAYIEAFRCQVELMASEILSDFFLDASGAVRPFEDRPEAAPSVTAYNFRKKLFAYFEDKGELRRAEGGGYVADDAVRRRLTTKQASFEANKAVLGPFADILERFRSVAGAVLDGKDALAALDAKYGMRASLEAWHYLMLDLPAKHPCNALMARALVAKLGTARDVRVFEGGAGIGVSLRSALEHPRFAAAAATLARYDYTEISPLLLDVGRQWLKANAPPGVFERIRFQRLDLDDLPKTAEPGATDLVLLEHVLYDVRDLRATLRAFHTMLKPGGWLVFTMSFRDRPSVFFANEIIQSMLHTYNKAELDPPRRENVGYLTLGEWELSLEDAGFSRWDVHPGKEHLGKCPFGGIVAYR